MGVDSGFSFAARISRSLLCLSDAFSYGPTRGYPYSTLSLISSLVVVLDRAFLRIPSTNLLALSAVSIFAVSISSDLLPVDRPECLWPLLPTWSNFLLLADQPGLSDGAPIRFS